MRYVQCIRNETLWEGDLAQTYDPILVVGHVYKVVPPEANDGPEWLRIIDEEGEDYIYPADYFNMFSFEHEEPAIENVSVHLGNSLKSILRAEALAAQTSVSALVRSWLEERLDLPAYQ